MHLGVVRLDRVGDLLHDRGLAGLGRRHDEPALALAHGREQIDDPGNPKTRFINLSGVLHDPDPSGQTERRHTRERNERFGNEGTLDEAIVLEARDVLTGASSHLVGRYKTTNANRDIGTYLSGKIAYLRGGRGLPPGAVDLTFTGSSGQSFGAFLVGGVRLKLIGEANDYVGKGMSGGEIVVRPKPEETFSWRENTILGNTCLYGATGGELFAAGGTGERFAVRNSGAVAVVESVGDHGCEYMTRGTVVVLGETGLNFGAGMSGGLAFVYDDFGSFERRCNIELVDVERLADADESESLRRLVERHAQLTESPHARSLVENWTAEALKFWKVAPRQSDGGRAKPLYRFE